MDHFLISGGTNTLPAHGELSVLFSGEGKPYPLHQIGPAVHNYFLVHTVVSGKGRFEMEGRQYDCGPGDSFFIFPDVLFTYAADEQQPWHYRWVAFQGEIAIGLLGDMGVTPDNPVVRAGNPHRLLRRYRQIQHALERTPYPELADLETGGLLRVLLKEFWLVQIGRTGEHTAQPFTDAERRINQAVAMMSLQYNKRISVEQLARKLGYHRTHLSKMFRQITGLSPMQFLLHVRMTRARELLHGQHHLSIDQVASSVGFPDALYFSKQFKKTFGVSPSEYRGRH